MASFLYHRPNLWDYPTTKPFTQYDYELFSDKSLLLEMIKAGCQEVFKYAPRDIIEDREFVLKAAKLNGLVVFGSCFTSDKEIMLEAVKNNGYALRFASEELKKILNW
ncbi:hypothetical protein FDP41_006047 [Naegleria fowleri]|uniref:DUF4116 domain-containing protein n=1 Tax=Naegleria fowleri TaxID=5763 RepID=A0A6A5BJ96_NAEFO|nr:uncharacterized protein FDP41_006047 [Naegleria fowleri]KAF0974942.1 hypothetical protein FDP41_006047 [Naegleria fowleri]